MCNGRWFVTNSDLVTEPTAFQGHADFVHHYKRDFSATQSPARTQPAGHQLTDQLARLLYNWKCLFKPILGTDVLETSKTNVKYVHIAKDIERRS